MVECVQCEKCRALRRADFDVNKLVAAKRRKGICKSFRILIISVCYKLGFITQDVVDDDIQSLAV